MSSKILFYWIPIGTHLMVSKISADWMTSKGHLIERCFNITDFSRSIKDKETIEAGKQVANSRQISMQWIQKRKDIISKPFPMVSK